MAELTSEQYWELVIGPAGSCHGCRPPLHDVTCRVSDFDSEVDREAAWWANREELMGVNDGCRPWGWWRYEHDGQAPPRFPVQERMVYLAERGLLEPGEIRTLMTTAAMREGDEGWQRVVDAIREHARR